MDRINNAAHAAASTMQHAAFDQHLREAAQHCTQESSADPSPCPCSAQQKDNIGEATQQPKLVVISNRVAAFDPLQPKTGGLAAALEPVVERFGAVWMGSSGNLGDGTEPLDIGQHGEGQVAKLDMPREHYSGYYEGFANSILWPALHSLPDRMAASANHYESYQEINKFLAGAAFQFRDRDAIWVHDYHFLPLGAGLHKLGVDKPIGFFLHTPWPAPDVMARVPNHRQLMHSMLDYDLLGFQTNWDLNNFRDCLRTHLGLEVEHGVVVSSRRQTRCQKFPIGIDHKQFAQYASESLAKPYIASLQKKLNGAKLAIGVDRLDYSKGIDARIEAFDKVLTDQPRSIVLLQIANPSRTEIEAYKSYKRKVESLVKRVNDEHGTDEWRPILYEYNAFTQAQLAGLYRTARVGVVTPVRDGMNLVAKEYIAAQDPDDPGVLVLSKSAGAAEDFNHNEALLVDPNSPDEIATAISKAANMPREERIQRWRPMMDKIEAYTIHDWSADFVRELDKSRVTVPADHFRHLGFGWINETQMPSYRTAAELDAALKRAMDRHWILPPTGSSVSGASPESIAIASVVGTRSGS
ncbi:MAG: trehalose-6-phosphate synthase [Mesorhizobium sp.]|uniref:alpha,alpha-trehalose-phosphate synthase (UDP-forming) n=1 Tax=unclassified Mesorhizobium TaxID=325217 RepID=UPI000FE9784E|nr:MULTISPECIES: trehalose-6-phosphate synthase [unclassified Mesorhizobium]RWC12756.1 MAG: trehalose-6-phosphate synthase [Mesorhizobium sp.]RWD74903.1 MAG: trehalose-6-phosphate synthase [Mesorhizobium sp.]RWE52588.1 MAG: trehalose-6-phosphate synthase [Mesorhizobium sp.]RWE90726.1 MAG: trehalose-6-phosphate synthase [Mesorhizobium sp.]RWF52492.1 MAG: trehalose-6-phosphate synthase [Mesorhizobium sp.]